MMVKKLSLFIFIFLAFGTIGVFGQNDGPLINHHIDALQTYSDKHPIEKVHLHLDKPWYNAGDTIWFKAYVVAAAYHQLTSISGVLYAELINDKDSVIKRLTVELNSGLGSGDFVLPYNNKSCVYHLRAYTNWMQNAGPGYFYNQRLFVNGLNSIRPNRVKQNTPVHNSLAQSRAANIDVQFFPEGGDMANGLLSKVAFKAVDEDGRPEEIKGIVIDSKGNEIVAFGSQHLGMGQFLLKPKKGEQYKAKIICTDASTYMVDLPQAKDAGFSLSINNDNRDTLYLKLTANFELYESKRDTVFYLVAQSGGKNYLTASDKVTNYPFAAHIAKSHFPSGIVQFTLFSQSGEPLNERVVFIQNNDQLNLTLSVARQTYAPGEKVQVSLGAKNAANKATAGSFSASVTDETKVPVDEPAENTIFTDLLLQSELTGTIENPNYYFTNPDDKTRADLDLLMLTQGYRRFEWKRILHNDNRILAFYPPEKLLKLAGTVKTPQGEPAPGANVSLALLKQKIVKDTTADSNGDFQFNNLYISDTAKLYLRAGKKNLEIQIKQPEYPPVLPSGTADTVNMTPQMALAAQKQSGDAQGAMKNTIVLKQVNIKSNPNPLRITPLIHSDNLNGPGQADQVIMGDKLMGCPYIANCLHALIRGGVRWQQDTVYSTHTPIELVGKTKPMAVLLDGVIMEQKTAFNMLNENDIYSIEVLVNRGYLIVYGTAASGGLIVITTKRGGEGRQAATVDPALTTYTFNGFYKAREFYSPKYDEKNKVSLADNRKTIYWNPEIITDAEGKASFEYFNAGSKGTYRIVVEGIDEYGKLGRQVLRYNVE